MDTAGYRIAGGSMRRPGRESGQALVEYAMILLFIVLTCVSAVALLGREVLGLYTGFNGRW